MDEAHAFGVFGEKGLALQKCKAAYLIIDLYAATFGKAVGSVGAFCCRA